MVVVRIILVANRSVIILTAILMVVMAFGVMTLEFLTVCGVIVRGVIVFGMARFMPGAASDVCDTIRMKCVRTKNAVS